MGMGISVENPMGMGMGMGMIFENGYGYRYRRTRPEPAPRPFLDSASSWPSGRHRGVQVEDPSTRPRHSRVGGIATAE